jgi:hypothetical protein
MSAIRRFVPFLALALMSQAASFAADHAAYDQKAFEAAQASNLPILLDVIPSLSNADSRGGFPRAA